MKKLDCPCVEAPKVGDVFRCEACGFTVTVTVDCTCKDCECVCLACCGKAMPKAN